MSPHQIANLKYAHSPQGKITRGTWYERNRARQLRLMRARYRRLHPLRILPCKAPLCGGKRLSNQDWCWSCASAFYGPVYASRRRRAA